MVLAICSSEVQWRRSGSPSSAMDLCMEMTKEIFELIFPPGLFDWFEITDSKSDAQPVSRTLTETDLPPLSNAQSLQKIVARKFHDMTITDFPPAGETHATDLPTTRWEAGKTGRVSETRHAALCPRHPTGASVCRFFQSSKRRLIPSRSPPLRGSTN